MGSGLGRARAKLFPLIFVGDGGGGGMGSGVSLSLSLSLLVSGPGMFLSDRRILWRERDEGAIFLEPRPEAKRIDSA